MQKPSIPKGMRDFSATQVGERNYIFTIIRSVFEKYGYQPIETPTMENLSTLMGKYGQEGDRLLFKVLNSGDYGKELGADELNQPSRICEKGLRYDLTVPFARYVVQHRAEITFPFKRYQIAPVWRADRPQKGRYREFVQCDVDVVGTRSLLCEVELIQIADEALRRLGIDVVIKINNRKILAGVAAYIGHPDSLIDIAVAIDKLDKIGIEGVEAELLSHEITPVAIEKLKPILNLSGTNAQKLEQITSIIGPNDGVDEIRQVFSYLEGLKISSLIELDLSLARGLNYYTGSIFEIKALDAAIGSISGGGRYDDLTGIFGMEGTSGVGISLGAERIYDVMHEKGLFPSSVRQSTMALVANFSEKDIASALVLVEYLRAAGISVELYPVSDKLKKQFDYAVSKLIPYIIFLGESELERGVVTIKHLESGEQSTILREGLVELLSRG
ncbi:MAG: histidine--tRNA ligase [Mucinivorans sp.]